MNNPLIHFVVSLLILVIVGTTYFFWYGHVVSVRAASIALHAEAASVQAQAAQIASARSALSKLAADESFFGSYFVSTSTVVSYLENLEATGEALGTSVEVISVTPGSDASRLAVSFKAEGSFAGVMRTLGAIEYGSYDALIANVNVETNASSEGKWIASGTVSVGMKPPEPPKPAAVKPELPPEADLSL